MKLLLSFIIIPLAASFMIALMGRRIKNAGSAIAVFSGICLFVFSLSALQLVNRHTTLAFMVGGWISPAGVCLVLDGFSSFMLVTVNLICALILIYAINYMDRYTDKWKFYALFMLLQAGMNGIIISGDIFVLYLFLEVASISGYCLVAFGTEAQDLEAAFKYAILGSLASVFILFGIALLYSYTSTLSMAGIASALSDKPWGAVRGFICVLFLAGFGLKGALVPFHAWLADAHSCAPSPVSAALSGVLIKTAGIYALVRIFYNVVGISANFLYTLMFLGALSMAVGAFLAITQNDIKRMFAYSSISQIGYIILAFGIGTPLAVLGGLFHLFNHAAFKSLLFLNAGSIEYSTRTRSLHKLGGLLDKLPVTGYTGFVGSMSIAGVPPLSGFWSKMIIIFAAVEAGRFGFAAIAAIVSIITLIYYLRFQSLAFMGTLSEGLRHITECPAAMKTAMIVLALLSLCAGVLLIPAYRPFLESAVRAVVSAQNYKDAVFSALR